MGLNTEARASIVFLILYAILFVIVAFGYATRRLMLHSPFTVIFFHVAIRLASQATGLAFSIAGYSATNLLVAYFILGAEGYFTLVLCTFRFLISWQCRNFAKRDSWLEPQHPPGTPFYRRLLDSFTIFGRKRNPMAVIHVLLIAANAIIISGGSQLAGGATDVTKFKTTLTRAKAMRLAGQSVFLSINASLLFFVGYTIKQCKRENAGRVHPTLWILLAVWPLLFTRGIYGILSGFVPIFNHFSPSNYGADGLKDGFVISEYILGATMEWCSCALLFFTYVTSLDDPSLAVEEKVGSNDQIKGKGSV